jgi:glycosyltransferase involved in cell wall biosynthesis
MVCALELSLHRTLRLYERYVDVFISPSRFLVETVERMGFRPADFRVIPGSTDLVYEEPLSMGDDAPLLFIGALRKEKGVELLLDAIRATGARLQIAGEGVERGFLEQLARTLGIADKVEFLGGCDRERLRMLLGGCMAVVVPSVWYENFPTVALEALACARPVVASRIGGIPEIVDDGINGILVEPGNSSELAGAIDRLRESRSLVRDMGTAGRDKALVEYAPSVYLDRIEAVFRDMCAGRRARA